MNTLTKNDDILLNNKEKGINAEIILSNIFDELIYDFKKKFIEKMLLLIDEIKNNGLITKINENKNNIKMIQERENKKECKLYNESILDVYLNSFMDNNKKSLLKQLKKEKNEEDVNDIYKKINYENDSNKKIEFLNSLKEESSNVTTPKKENKNKDSCIVRNELIKKLNSKMYSKLDNNMEDISYLSSLSDYKYIQNNINRNESINELKNSNKSNGMRDLNTLVYPEKKNKKKKFSNINNKYNANNIISNKFFRKYKEYFDYSNDEINLNSHEISTNKIIRNIETSIGNNSEDEKVEKLNIIYNSKSFLTSKNCEINLEEKKYENLDKMQEKTVEKSKSKLCSHEFEDESMKNYLEDELKENKNLNNYRQSEFVSNKTDTQNKKINESKKCKHIFFEVVRGKRRKNLKGFDCEDCKLFYNELYSENSESGMLRKDKMEVEYKQKVEKGMQIKGNSESLNKILIKNSEPSNEFEEEIYNNSAIDNVKKNNKNDNTSDKKSISSILYKNDQRIYNCESNNSSNKCVDNSFDDRNKNYNLIKGAKKDNYRKEKEKKKIIQSFSRHRYHSKVNDSPQNFWNFDFFK